MDTFTASNGITVYVRDGGTVQFQHGTRDESCGILQVFPHSEWWQTLREFFRAEEDERLGRWRWPENLDYVVYAEPPGLDWVRVVCESKALMVRMDRKKACHEYVDRTVYQNAARAYFVAHPGPKPWDDAKPGEVWAFKVDGLDGEYAASHHADGEWAWADGGPVNVAPGGLLDGRRIWPEVTP